MQTQLNSIVRKPATKKAAAKKTAAHRHNGASRSASDRKIDEIVRLARKLKGSFGLT